MKKLLLALAIGASISTGASAVTCGENQQPDYTNSYCEDVEVTTNYATIQDVFNDLTTEDQEQFMEESCDQLYQVFLNQLIEVRKHTTLICDAVCKVKRSSFLPLGEYSKVEGVSMTFFNNHLRWIATAVMKKDPELTSGDSIYNDFIKECRAKNNTNNILDIYQRVVNTKFGGDVNKFLKFLDNPQSK